MKSTQNLFMLDLGTLRVLKQDKRHNVVCKYSSITVQLPFIHFYTGAIARLLFHSRSEAFHMGLSPHCANTKLYGVF